MEAEVVRRTGPTSGQTKGCGQCAGCKRPNCDSCKFCMDNPRNGGKNRLKKRCLLRVCTNFSVPDQSLIGYGAQTRSAFRVGLVGDPNNRPKRQKVLPKKLSGNAMEVLGKSPRLTTSADAESRFGRKALRMAAGGKIGGRQKTHSVISSYELRRQLKLDMAAPEQDPWTPRLKVKTGMVTQAKGQSKGCGQCVGCRRPNCDACKYCMDNPRNGGKNKLRKRCLLRVCTNMPVRSPARYRTQILSASSPGLKGEVTLEQGSSETLPSMSSEHQEPVAAPQTPMDAESVHTAVVMVDDPDDHSTRQKILPKTLTDNAMEIIDRKQKAATNVDPESHLGRKTLMMTAGEKNCGVPRTRSEVSVRTLRHRPGPLGDVSPGVLIEKLPSGGKYSKLRRQLKIEMAGPGTTLSQQMTDSEGDSSRQTSGVASATSPLMMAADALSLLANGAACKPKLPSSPLEAKTSKLRLHDNPLMWNVDEVQQYLASCGFLDISLQLKEEVVDGEAMMDLTPVWLVKCLGIKMGPAIKLCKCVEGLKAKTGTDKCDL